MPELTPTGAVDVVQRQIRRVRRRKNLFELQRTCYLTVAAAAGVATVLLPLALYAPAGLFAAAAWTALALLGVGTIVLLSELRRHWLTRPGAVAWIETRGRLAGRLRTLIELAPRPSAVAGFFHALLVAQVGRDLDSWAPRRLMPRGVPRLPLATAVLALLVLAGVLQLASLVIPAPPGLRMSDEAMAAGRTDGSAEGLAGERAVVAPGVPRGNRPSSGVDDGGTDSTLTRLPSALQENVRQQVWGKAWERVREALARAGTSGSNNGAMDDSNGEVGEQDGADASEEWEIARAPTGELTRRRRSGIGRQPNPRDRDDDAKDGDEAAEAGDADHQENQGREGGGGAGNTTSPDDLFGAPPDDTPPAEGSFELSLAARMRADGATGRRSGGTAPNADPDARPELAPDQRRENAAHRMTVPPAYETVVREVFAHRGLESEEP